MMVPHDERPPFPRPVRRGVGRRERDRRNGFVQMLASLSERRPTADTRRLKQVFEDELRRLVPVRDLRVRELPPRYGPPSTERSSARESIAFEVPSQDPSRPMILEATFEPGCGLDEWDFQMLGTARYIASLVLDAEKGRPLRAVHTRRDGAAAIIGSSRLMQALRDRIERVAATDFTVLIEGESGTGKELVARQIHELSARRHGPFVAINCAALVETLLEAELFGIEERTATGVRGRRGKFEHADGGTLFLDEVSDLSISAQAKLLRAIQDLAVERVGGQGTKRVDTRIIAATNRSLCDLVKRGLFRSDLYYRIGGVDVHVPPLRSRRDDVLELAEYFLARHRDTRPLRLTRSVIDVLQVYEWPGNVRELQRLMEHIVTLAQGDDITLDDVPATVRGHYATTLQPSLARGDTLRAWASRYAWIVLERCGHNKRRACAALGISYHTLQAYLKHYARLTQPTTASVDGEAGSTSASEADPSGENSMVEEVEEQALDAVDV
jgi:DNA-binding NtrC family response regulator